jgi:hypothetical protein
MMKRETFIEWFWTCAAFGIFALLLWGLFGGCATGLPGSGDTKLREYMYEGIKFTVEAGAQNVTQ